MNTLPIAGTMKSVSFYPDDTIQTIRQYLALEMNTHPDRMFIQIKIVLPSDYYLRNPKEWTGLFLRLSQDGQTVSVDSMRTYLEQIRLNTGITAKQITKEEWEEKDEYLAPLYNPGMDFEEYRVFGVPEALSFVLPLPPRDIAIPSASIPIPQTASLFETLYPFETREFQITIVEDGMGDFVLRNYFPLLKQDAPNNIENLRASIESTRNQYEKLMGLDTPIHETLHVLRVKWYIPFVGTSIPAPRSRFEQIFYGMTVNEKTPYIGYFTAKTETMRHKFYVEDPKTKKPWLDTSMFKSWYATTQPQRRLPTLLLYRGKTRSKFDRIAITSKDITVDIHRDKTSTESLEEMKQSIFEWMKTLDALVPFIDMGDIELSRWTVGDMSVLATYKNDIKEFDMHRFPCLTQLFSLQNENFRLLRAERTSTDLEPIELQALQVLSEDDAERTPNFLAERLNLSIEEATNVFRRILDLSEESNIEKTLRSYPIVKFSNNEVILKFITNIERTLKYASILRFVLTSDSESVNEVCPRRMEKVAPKIAIPQQELNMDEEFSPDDELNALLGFSMGEEEEEKPEEGTETVEKKLKVQKKSQGTYNYFNARLQKFDPDTFDKSIHPSKCDKPKQVVAITPQDKERMGSQYNYEDAPENEKLPVETPNATLVCPPYWCMRDEIPLRESQLTTGEDGELHCPVCSGKVRSNDTQDTAEYTVIKRDATAKYPDFMKVVSSINKRKIPCCYQKPRSTSGVLTTKEDVSYVLDPTSTNVPGRRMVFLTNDVAKHLRVSTDYEKSVKKGRLLAGEGDVFRVGLGSPLQSLPVLLGDKTKIAPPSEAREKTIACSFFRTWKKGTTMDEKVASINEAFETGSLSFLEELEYATAFLRCEVVLMKLDSKTIQCGFWSETLGANSRTILVVDNTVLCYVSRNKSKADSKPKFNCDLRNKPFDKDTLPLIRSLHQQACSANVPILDDAIQELRNAGVSEYQVILDPYNRIQAVFVPERVILPVRPTSTKPDAGVPVRNDYSDIRDEELPDGSAVRTFLQGTQHPGFKKTADLQDINGMITEFLLASGYRIPIQAEEPDEGPDYAAEVLQTVRNASEDELVSGNPNQGDTTLAQEISYSQEIYEFLLFALSKDLQSDDFGDLRTMIESKNASLYKTLKKWFHEHSYKDTTKSPIDFISKVRTPCGQMTTDECKKSTLCGINAGVCKIRVKPIVEEDVILKRMVKVLRDNDKQRALVLDGTVSPFFSTVLFLQMPHEWITTSV